MAEYNSVQNIWTSCLLVEAWVVYVTLQHLCPDLLPFKIYIKKAGIGLERRLRGSYTGHEFNS